MNLARRDLADEATRWRSSRKPHLRAVADNLAFEENVSGDRQQDFESFAAEDDGLHAHLVGYAREMVTGASADHLPITFTASNEPALLTKIEPNQRVARLLRVDRALSAIVPRDEVPSAFARLAATLGPSGPDEASAAPLIRQLNEYPGAGPNFACLRSEIADDLTASDWLPRLVARLGLGHIAPEPGETFHFVLMQYLVSDVLAARPTKAAAACAIPTALDQEPAEFFFPPPKGLGWGFTADLQPEAARPAVREFLHCRIPWKTSHIAKFGTLTGPIPRAPLATLRDAHLARLRRAAGRPTFGEEMTPAVDAEA